MNDSTNRGWPQRKGERGLISVIMPAWNSAAFIESAIESVLGQSYPHVELIVVDDGSTDATEEILKRYAPRIAVVTQAHKGAASARNRGLRMARGEFIAFLDSDDYWRPDCLELLHAQVAGTDAVLAYCGWQNIGLKSGQSKPYIPPDYERLGPSEKMALFLKSCPWPIHAALTRTAVIEEVGGFDEGLRASMDYDLWLRVAACRKVLHVPHVLAFYRHHEGPQITKQPALSVHTQWLIKQRFLRQHLELRRQLGRRRVREIMLGELLREGYVCYWRRDLRAARTIFRLVMKTGFGTFRDWTYMLPALLPFALHGALISLRDGRGAGMPEPGGSRLPVFDRKERH